MVHKRLRMEKRWQLADKMPAQFSEKYPEYDSITRQLLYNRGLEEPEEIEEFFYPDYTRDLHDPFLLRDMDRLVDKVGKAAAAGKKMAVYGDYDADGVTTTAVLTEFLEKVLGVSGLVYLPERETEGYGLNRGALEYLAKQKVELVITGDCGVSSKADIDWAQKKGIEVVVIDHHHLPVKYGKDYIVVDPRREDNRYPFVDLAAVGVAFKFVQAFFRRGQKYFPRGVEPSFEKWLLDLVAIGTVADCVSLLGENRTLTRFGLEILKRSRRPGLKALMAASRIDPNNMESTDIAFRLAPRLNSAGRMDHANAAYKLLVCENEEEAQALVEALDKTNRDRQARTEKIVEEALAQIGTPGEDEFVLSASGRDWPLGVIGVVAGRLTERFGRPVIVFGQGESESVGSGRSIEGFNLILGVEKYAKLLIEYGGHKGAAGVTVANNQRDEFMAKLNRIAAETLAGKDLRPVLKVEMEVALTEVNWDLVEIIDKFQPFGIDNEEPCFLSSGVELRAAKAVGADQKHLQLTVGRENSLSGIGFNLGDRVGSFAVGDKVDLVYQLLVDQWNGQKKLKLRIEDIRKSQ